MFNEFAPLLVIPVLIFAIIPIGFVCTAIAGYLRFGREPRPEQSQGQVVVDLSIYALGLATLLCLLCLVSIRYHREFHTHGGAVPLLLGALGIAFELISAAFALFGRGSGRLTMLIGHGLLTLVLLGGRSRFEGAKRGVKAPGLAR